MDFTSFQSGVWADTVSVEVMILHAFPGEAMLISWKKVRLYAGNELIFPRRGRTSTSKISKIPIDGGHPEVGPKNTKKCAFCPRKSDENTQCQSSLPKCTVCAKYRLGIITS